MPFLEKQSTLPSSVPGFSKYGTKLGRKHAKGCHRKFSVRDFVNQLVIITNRVLISYTICYFHLQLKDLIVRNCVYRKISRLEITNYFRLWVKAGEDSCKTGFDKLIKNFEKFKYSEFNIAEPKAPLLLCFFPKQVQFYLYFKRTDDILFYAIFRTKYYFNQMLVHLHYKIGLSLGIGLYGKRNVLRWNSYFTISGKISVLNFEFLSNYILNSSPLICKYRVKIKSYISSMFFCFLISTLLIQFTPNQVETTMMLVEIQVKYIILAEYLYIRGRLGCKIKRKSIQNVLTYYYSYYEVIITLLTCFPSRYSQFYAYTQKFPF